MASDRKRSGPEADNMALMGTALAETSGRKHIITPAIEHHAVLNTCKHLKPPPAQS